MEKQYYGTGRRKKATARVFMRPGKGEIMVNGARMETYFCNDIDRMFVRQPLELVDMMGRFDFYVTVDGGGVTGQAGAVRHGITRALLQYDLDNGEASRVDAGESEGQGALGFRPVLRGAGLVTRDPRQVERKKYGRRKARKKEQYSKR